MVEPHSIFQVLEVLEREGYTEDFKAHRKAMRMLPSNIEVDPQDLLVDKIYHFLGETDIGDEEIVFALTCPINNIKGTYFVALGPMMDPLDGEIVQSLRKNFSSLPRK